MYFYIKAFHIIFVVSWFAGLFYIVRLFIYHTEAEDRSPQEKALLQNQFKIMEKRLWNIITVPAMLITLVSGLLMFYLNPELLKTGWMHIKLTFLIGLIVYHLLCFKILKDLQKDIIRRSSAYLRIWNEVATFFLVVISFIVILKHPVNWIWGVLAVILLGVLVMIGLKIFKKVS